MIKFLCVLSWLEPEFEPWILYFSTALPLNYLIFFFGMIILRNLIPLINHKLFMWDLLINHKLFMCDFYAVITKIKFLMVKYYN